MYDVWLTSSQNVDCPSDECHTFSYYGKDKLKSPENNAVTMILLKGNHSLSAHRSVYNFGSPDNSHSYSAY